MKLKIGLIVVIAAGFMSSFAMAASPNKGGNSDKGQSTTTTAKVKKAKKTCKPNVSLILRGELVQVADPNLTVAVKQTNKHARSFKGKQATVQTDAKTRILRLGERVSLADLVAGDSLNIRARACKRGELPATPLAVRVVAKPAQPAS